MSKSLRIGLIVLVLAVIIAVALYFILGTRPDADDNANIDQTKGGTTLTAPTTEEIEQMKTAGTIAVTIATAKGNININLRGDLMPLTTANFVKLAGSGFYDGLIFHRVEDWVVQGGDPTGLGSGGPGYAIKLETHTDMRNVRGAVAMARSPHPDSAGSQFYILREDAIWLDGDYAVFGYVTSGMDVVDKLAKGDIMTSVTVAPYPI